MQTKVGIVRNQAELESGLEGSAGAQEASRKRQRLRQPRL